MPRCNGRIPLAQKLAAGEVNHQAKDEASVFHALVHAVAKSTEFENVAFVRVLGQGESVEVLAQVGDMHDAAGTPRMSRSMLRPAREVEEVLNEIQKCLGKHFDPELGKIFLSIPIEHLRKHVVKTSLAQAKLRSI